MSERWSAAQWSRYWERGTVTTFHGRFEGNYDGAVREYWHERFAALPEGARVVDLATGNGALALLAQRFSARRELDLRITGVDYADIDPARQFAGRSFARHLRRIEFKGGARLEDTGLPAGAFDLAMSQFGFEYGDPGAAAAEVARLLKGAGATFAAMLHHRESAIVRQARDGLAQIAACVKSGLTASVRDLHRHLDQLAKRGKDPQEDSRAIELRADINRILADLQREGARHQDPGQLVFYVENSMATFNPQLTAGKSCEEKLAMLTVVGTETDAYRQRMRDLVSASLDDAQIAEVRRRFDGHGFDLRDDRPFVFEGAHFCHLLRFER